MCASVEAAEGRTAHNNVWNRVNEMALNKHIFDNIFTGFHFLMCLVLLTRCCLIHAVTTSSSIQGLLEKAVQNRTLYYHFFVPPDEGHAAETRQRFKTLFPLNMPYK